jgi:hypothetical protein
MAAPEAPDPVKLIVAMIWADAAARDESTDRITLEWGPIDFTGADYLFNVTEYYAAEMGSPLMRRLISFERLVGPDCLPAAKLCTNEIETAVAAGGRRSVNLDVGILDHSKIVLASAKFAGQKIYLGDGIWADPIARYKAGRYQSFEWTFPDFRDGRYDRDLEAIRRRYMTQLRAERRGPATSSG